MKISIVTPVFNEEKSVTSYCKAVFSLDYNIIDFEVVIVDDGSCDGTVKLFEKFRKDSKIKLKIISLGKNAGRSIARLEGAKAAKYGNILFMDAKCEILPDALKAIKKINYSPINPLILQKKNNIFDLFFYILRRAFYKKNFGENFAEQYINKKNFDSMAKGTTMFFCDKKLFLKSQPSNINSKNNSDDTALLANIVKKKPILATPLVRCWYNTRGSFIQNIRHIFNRGPKFVDYYYVPSRKHFWLINSVFVFILLVIYRVFSREISAGNILSGLVLLDIFLALYVARGLKEFLVFLLLFPVFSAIFMLGVIKGVFLKFFSKL
jgi:glycosyltransferase involved in cell wall biosynthesis